MPVPDPVTFVRGAASATIRGLFATSDDVRTAPTAEGDAGLFGPDSVTWQVHAHLSMLVGGVRTLLVQTLHPLAMAGVAQHSQYRTDPLGRLGRTAAFVGATTYGTTADADAAIKTVRRIHGQVRGVASDGRAYSANDPELLAWVHHVEVQSFLLAYQRIGPGLPTDEADRYIAEMAHLGARLGVSESLTTAATLHDWVRTHPELRATAEARAAVRFLMWPTLPLVARGPSSARSAGHSDHHPRCDDLRTVGTLFADVLDDLLRDSRSVTLETAWHPVDQRVEASTAAVGFPFFFADLDFAAPARGVVVVVIPSRRRTMCRAVRSTDGSSRRTKLVGVDAALAHLERAGEVADPHAPGCRLGSARRSRRGLRAALTVHRHRRAPRCRDPRA